MSAIAAEPPLNVSALWRAARFPAVLVVIGLALVTILAAIGKAPNTVPLDPRNETPNGTHALAALLSDRGITVSIANSIAQLDSSNASTIVVAQPLDLSDRALAAISTSSATVLLVDPLQHALSAFGVDATLDDTIAATTLEPACQLAAAVTAGSVRISGDLYAVGRGATACYPEAGDAALLESTRASGGRTVVLGSASALTNANLAAAGDAALDLGLLTTQTVQWVPGGLGAGLVPKSQRGLLNLLPSRLLWATLQLFIALVVLALWRARRLGRPVVEPLPVVVRAAETVEGRARMLHAAHARGAAAQSLRRATLRRLAHLLRLGPDEDPASVAALVAERTDKPATEINALLYGDEPTHDAALVRLAQELPQLETALRGHDGGSPGGQQ
jgi:Domain of unknown function (DUF4350)